jgi:hypothetical protein
LGDERAAVSYEHFQDGPFDGGQPQVGIFAIGLPGLVIDAAGGDAPSASCSPRFTLDGIPLGGYTVEYRYPWGVSVKVRGSDR